jgi:hypothetical protein
MLAHNNHNIERLNSILLSFGDCVPLTFRFDFSQLAEELNAFAHEWKPYNPRKPEIRRKGLSVTSLDGGLSGIGDLDSIKAYNSEHGTKLVEMSFQTKTPVYTACKSLHPLFNAFGTDMGRTHFLKLDAGGFFPPHRDLDLNCFRVFLPCFRANKFNFSFILDDKLLSLREGIAYFINTRKAHSVFSYVAGSTHLVLNIRISENSIQAIMNNLIEH